MHIIDFIHVLLFISDLISTRIPILLTKHWHNYLIWSGHRVNRLDSTHTSDTATSEVTEEMAAMCSDRMDKKRTPKSKKPSSRKKQHTTEHNDQEELNPGSRSVSPSATSNSESFEDHEFIVFLFFLL